MKKLLLGCLALCAIVSLLFVPSSNITEESYQTYINLEEENGFLGSRSLFATALAEGTFGSEPAIPIPRDEMIGRKPILANFTENTYEDPTIKVRIEDGRYKDANYHVAYVDIADPSQLRTAVSGKITGSKTIQMSDLAPKMNAIVAINGDFYSQNKVGYVIREGQVMRKNPSNSLDVLLIDSEGDFHIVTSKGKAQAEEVKTIQENHDIVNALTFGPALVIDGQIQTIPEHYQYAVNYKNPRAAIMQIDKLKYALIMVEGRSDESGGVTAAELAEICKSLNAKQAYNLDGGNSAVLYFKDKLYNQKSKENERFISDIIYFTTAVVE